MAIEVFFQKKILVFYWCVRIDLAWEGKVLLIIS